MIEENLSTTKNLRPAFFDRDGRTRPTDMLRGIGQAGILRTQ